MELDIQYLPVVFNRVVNLYFFRAFLFTGVSAEYVNFTSVDEGEASGSGDVHRSNLDPFFCI